MSDSLELCHVNSNVKQSYRWGTKGEEFSFNPHDFIAKVVARGLACSNAKPYRKRVKTHVKL